MTVPIATSPGRSGFGPQLALSYDSGAGNGPFGFGWNLSLPAITRKTDKGLPQYLDAEDSDVFVLSLAMCRAGPCCRRPSPANSGHQETRSARRAAADSLAGPGPHPTSALPKPLT